MFIKSCVLAAKDYYHETLLSACAVLSLAAVLTPLLVLYGVKFGIISTMTDRLQNNPHNLEIIPVSSGHYTKTWIEDMQKNPHVGFILPKTRSISATMDISLQGETSSFKRITVSLEPTAQGDTLLAPYLTASVTQKEKQPENTFAITLSAEAARRISAKPFSVLQGYVERTHKGKIERAHAILWVQAILPLEIQQQEVAFIPLNLLEATEDFRDGRKPKSDARLQENAGWTGDDAPSTERIYASFRLYAKNLNGVTTLREFFATKAIDVYTKAEEIAAVQALNTSLNLIFGLIGFTAALGFLASTASHALAAVRRKERYLGILRLIGYTGKDIMAFPLFQSFLTATLGSLTAGILYAIAAYFIDYLFNTSLQNTTEKICSLPPEHFFLGFGIVLCLSLCATFIPATKAAKIIPSEVIRDI